MVTPSLMHTILTTRGIDFAAMMNHMVLWWLEGEVVPMQVVKKFSSLVPNVDLINVYASWEALDNCYGCLSNQKNNAFNSISKFAPVGDVMPHVQVYVCDDNMTLKRIGQPGQVYIGTPAMFLG